MQEDFIGIYEGAFSKEYCETVIALMDKAYAMGYGFSRQDVDDMNKHEKDDLQLYANTVLQADSIFTNEMGQHFNEVFWGDCYKKYSGKYSVLQDLPNHGIHGNKLQKTSVGQGYHVWHCEHANNGNAGRILAYIVYLNDVEEGGETEFLYQHKRLKPTQGTVVIFPAGFTHTHRGNPPLSNTKYIMTGWVEY